MILNQSLLFINHLITLTILNSESQMSMELPTYCRPKDIEENADPRDYAKNKKEIMLPKNMSCGICLTEYNERDRIATCKVQMIVQHSFHERCLREWLSAHIRCPCCRNPVKRPLQIIEIRK